MAGNLPKDWGAMITLTVPENPAFPKVFKEKWLRAWAQKVGLNVQWLIIMEFTKRGVCHWHFFVEKEFIDSRIRSGDCWEELLVRRGEPTTVLRGPFEDWVVHTWTMITGNSSSAFQRFQRGGIIELIRHPDGAARYVSKECSKREQKQLPEGVDPQGAWWGYNKRFRPVMKEIVEVKQWPYDRFYTRIFDAADFLRREKLTPQRRTLQVTTSYNICVAKAQATLALKNDSH